MKTTMLVLFIVLAVGTAFAQSIDTTATPAGNFYADSLKSAAYPVSRNGSARDTIVVVVSSMSGVDFYELTVWGNASANDTLIVSALTNGNTLYVQRAVVNLASGATAASAIVGATLVDFAIAGGPEVKSFRFTSTGSTDDMHFIIRGSRGWPVK
jgi:hypothetical protein